MTKDQPKLAVHTGARAWDTIWKWAWFAKAQWQPNFRKSKEGTRRALASLLPKLRAKTILDCSCGLGRKTILLAEMGYEVEGCDRSRVAVAAAAELAREEGLAIRFFRSRWEELEKNCRRTYDCVYNDAFAWITRRSALLASARGIHSVLKRGGTFIFRGAHQWSPEDYRRRLIEETLKLEGRFEVLPRCERGGVRLNVIEVREERPDGVLDNRIHIIEDRGRLRVEVASILDASIWTWSDYTETLRKAGFKRVYSVKEPGVGPKPYILNVAVK